MKPGKESSKKVSLENWCAGKSSRVKLLIQASCKPLKIKFLDSNEF